MRMKTLLYLLLLALFFLPSVSHALSRLTEDEIMLMEEMQKMGLPEDQINKIIAAKVSIREDKKKWTQQELADLDAQLKSRWQAMIYALANNDIDSAVKYFNTRMRDVHKMLLSATNPDQRAQLLKTIEEIKMVDVKGSNYAEYKLKVPKTRDVYYYNQDLIFIRNEDGTWEIRSF
jgi:hypothetical protein